MSKKGGVTSGKIVFRIFSSSSSCCVEGVDASSVDVYENCHACVFIIDPRNV